MLCVRICSLLLLCVVSFVSMSHAAQLTIYTEEYPPYNTKASGTLGGINTEKMLAMFDKAGIALTRDDIQLVPWARAYNAAQKSANTCVYSTTFTEERKDLFAWVGPLSTTNTSLVAFKGKGHDTPLESLSAATGKVGVITEDVGEQLVLAQGMPESQLEKASSSQANINKLKAGRIAYFAYEVNALRELAKEMDGIEPSDFVGVYTLNEGELWLACHPQTDSATLQKLQSALDSLQ